MSNYIPVEGHPGLVRDKKSGAIININISEIEMAKQRKLAKQKQIDELNDLKEEVKTLHEDIDEIKQLLKRLVQ